MKFYYAFTLVADVLISIVGLHVDNINKVMHKYGYQMRGFEVMYNGHTGQKLNAHLFLVPIYTNNFSTWWMTRSIHEGVDLFRS